MREIEFSFVFKDIALVFNGQLSHLRVSKVALLRFLKRTHN